MKEKLYVPCHNIHFYDFLDSAKVSITLKNKPLPRFYETI